ncbi:MAG: hypothetical protein RMI56_02660 [Sulfolobales archaeon]|nr:hypothetical protein [Sulfolobales archaeon]MDW8082680.1 hypothetical protein [Sulfolobales archaeon]
MLTLALLTEKLRLYTLLPIAQTVASAASLYFLGEALVLRNPGSLALGVAFSVSALLVAYVENKVLLLKTRIGCRGTVVLIITVGTLLYTFVVSLPALSYVVENHYGIVEIAAYSGLLYVGASLPYSSIILFALVYLIYDTLHLLQSEESPQFTQETGGI